jgi:hypothetical protein
MDVRGALVGLIGTLRMCRRWVESVRRRSKISSEDKGGQSGNQGVQTQTSAQQLASVRVEGNRIVVEREVELETV